MKLTSMVIISLVWSSLAFAATCPDLSGTYKVANNLVMKLEQTECLQIVRTMGSVSEDGIVTYSGHLEAFNLSGTPVCNPQNLCESATSTQDSINFKKNYDGPVSSQTHGRCTQRSYNLSKDVDGNLTSVFQVYGCQDKYVGAVTTVYSKF